MVFRLVRDKGGWIINPSKTLIRGLFFYIWRVNKKWFIFGFLVALAFLGISLEPTVAPNQEIVVEFNTDSTSSQDAQQAISEITQQLESIGVSDIQVSEMLDGKLRVIYYSTTDVAVIKNLFNKRDNLHLGYSAFDGKENSSKIPFGNDSGTYKLEVVKIQKDYGSDLGFHGFPVEIKSLKDQYLNQFYSFGNFEINFDLKNSVEREIGKNYQNIPLSKDNSSHKIPEVRAGPLS